MTLKVKKMEPVTFAIFAAYKGLQALRGAGKNAFKKCAMSGCKNQKLPDHKYCQSCKDSESSKTVFIWLFLIIGVGVLIAILYGN